MKIKLQVHHVKRDMDERLPLRDEMVMIWVRDKIAKGRVQQTFICSVNGFLTGDVSTWYLDEPG